MSEPMTRIPRPALILTALGVLPFLWGALTVLHPSYGQMVAAGFGPRFTGPYIGLFYGSVILSFMSGVLWGFATKAAGRRAALAYTLSVLPALWAFFMTGGGPEPAARALMAGFAGIVVLDWLYHRWGLAPDWWLHLRLPVTAVVLLCLLPVAL